MINFLTTLFATWHCIKSYFYLFHITIPLRLKDLTVNCRTLTWWIWWTGSPCSRGYIRCIKVSITVMLWLSYMLRHYTRSKFPPVLFSLDTRTKTYIKSSTRSSSFNLFVLQSLMKCHTPLAWTNTIRNTKFCMIIFLLFDVIQSHIKVIYHW